MPGNFSPTVPGGFSGTVPGGFSTDAAGPPALPVTPDRGSAGYRQLDQDFWEARERYLRWLSASMAAEVIAQARTVPREEPRVTPPVTEEERQALLMRAEMVMELNLTTRIQAFWRLARKIEQITEKIRAMRELEIDEEDIIILF